MRYNMNFDPRDIAERMGRDLAYARIPNPSYLGNLIDRVTRLHGEILQMERFCEQDGLIPGDTMDVDNVGRNSDDHLVILDLGGVASPGEIRR